MLNAPDPIKNSLISELSKWQSATPQALNSEDALRAIKEASVYCIRMCWQNRRDKMSRDRFEAFSWVLCSKLKIYSFISINLDLIITTLYIKLSFYTRFNAKYLQSKFYY